MNVQNRTIFEGDNLPILRGMDTESVDLIYLDPPFNSNRNYSAPIGSDAAGAAFKDTWTLDDVDNAWHGEIADKEPALYQAIHTAELTHSKAMKSYLIMMAIRLIEMKRILKDTGSIYLHCDLTAGHYLKILMDSIFGKGNFGNEIIWHYFKPHGSKTCYPKNYDSVLYYVKKNGNQTFNFDAILVDYDEKAIKRYNRTDDNGKRYKLYNNKDGKVRKSYMKDGKPENVFRIPIVRKVKERTGYPTQKPIALLERILAASSNQDGVILDPFCGCATTCIAAERLQRQWIGIDLSPKAVELVKMRLEKELGMFYDVIHRTDIPKRSEKLPNYRTHKHVLFGEQEGLCNGCKTQFPFRNMTIDHVIPQTHGGTHHKDNLQLLCGACNSMKGTGTQAELIDKLHKYGILKAA